MFSCGLSLELILFCPWPAHKIVSRAITEIQDQASNILTEAEIGNHEAVHALFTL